MRFLRFLKIFFTIVRFGLDELVLSGIKDRRVRILMRITTFGRKFDVPRGERLRLALEPLPVVGIGGKQRRQDLERDAAVEARVFGHEDLAHPTFPERFDDPIVPDDVATIHAGDLT